MFEITSHILFRTAKSPDEWYTLAAHPRKYFLDIRHPVKNDKRTAFRYSDYFLGNYYADKSYGSVVIKYRGIYLSHYCDTCVLAYFWRDVVYAVSQYQRLQVGETTQIFFYDDPQRFQFTKISDDEMLFENISGGNVIVNPEGERISVVTTDKLSCKIPTKPFFIALLKTSLDFFDMLRFYHVYDFEHGYNESFELAQALLKEMDS